MIRLTFLFLFLLSTATACKKSTEKKRRPFKKGNATSFTYTFDPSCREEIEEMVREQMQLKVWDSKMFVLVKREGPYELKLRNRSFTMTIFDGISKDLQSQMDTLHSKMLDLKACSVEYSAQ